MSDLQNERTKREGYLLALRQRDEARSAVWSLYLALREVTDSGLVDLDEIRANGGDDVADIITRALTEAADVLVSVDPHIVK